MTPSLFVIHEIQNRTILKRTGIPEGACSVGLRAEAPRHMRAAGYDVAGQDIGYVPGGTHFDLQVEADLAITFFVFRQDQFTAAARTMIGEAWDRVGAQGLIAPARVSALQTLADHLLAGRTPPDDAQRICLSLALSRLADALSQAEPVPLRAEPYHAITRRACEFIDAHAAEGITILDVCAATGVERRRLQRAFERVMGINPQAYLQAVKLNRVRTILRSTTATQTTVFDVASRCGFWHLSRFTQTYQRMFGETPAQTLRRDLSKIG